MYNYLLELILRLVEVQINSNVSVWVGTHKKDTELKIHVTSYEVNQLYKG